MSDVLVPSIRVKLEWWVLEKLVKLGLDSIRGKINGWENKQLQLKLNIIDEKRITIDGLAENMPYMLIGLHLDSKIPEKLCPEKIFGKLEAKGCDIDFAWDRRGKDVSKHIVKDITAYGKSWWGFHLRPSFTSLKNNAKSKWTVHFIVVFQHQLSKTFKDVEFKIRDSDAKLVQTFQEAT
jgi:hypothetical protein